MIIQFEELRLDVRPSQTHEWGLTTAQVAEGFGVGDSTIREHKRTKSDELIEGKHFISVRITDAVGNQAITYWTKKGVVRLGFMIGSERAKRFRDWAEDLILNVIEKPALPQTYKEAVAELLNQLEEKDRLQAENDSLKPIAQYAQSVLLSQSELLTTLIANDMHMSAVNLNRILKEKGIQRKVRNTWILTQPYQDKGYARMRTHVHSSTSGAMRTEHHLVWTERGREFIHSLVNPNLGDQSGNQLSLV